MTAAEEANRKWEPLFNDLPSLDALIDKEVAKLDATAANLKVVPELDKEQTRWAQSVIIQSEKLLRQFTAAGKSLRYSLP